MRHIQNLVKCLRWWSILTILAESKQFIQAFLGIQRRSAIFSHVQTYWRTLRHIQELLRPTEIYPDISKSPCIPCIWNRAIFRTLAHLQPELSPKVCQTWKMIRHIQSFGIVRTVYKHLQEYLRTFRDIYAYSVTGVQLGKGGGGGFPSPFLKIKNSTLIFYKRRPWLSPSLG